jgi:cobalt-zinc-cadmium efflux system outer membrane protein
MKQFWRGRKHEYAKERKRINAEIRRDTENTEKSQEKRRGNDMRGKGRMIAMTFLEASGVASKASRAIALAVTLALGSGALAQDMKMTPQHEEHEHGEMHAVKPAFPHMGRAQERAQGNLLTLDQVQKMAADSNPTLRQAEAEIRAAKALQEQSGLYPNPALGYTGDEIRGGSVGGGKQGFFVEQTIVTGGKLGLNKAVFGNDAKLAEIEAEEQKIRVQTAVKSAFLRVLAAQELLDTRRDLAIIAQDAVETQRRLENTGQADDTEVLEAEVEAQRMRMMARMQENSLREEWRGLAAVIGQSDLPLKVVAGDLEKDWPELNEERAVEAIAKESPAIRIAETAEARAETVLARAKREPVPDIQMRGGLEYNHETLGSVPFAKGWEGLGELSVQIPVFNRNQGAIAAARAEIDRAGQEKKRIALTLRERAASVVDQYANARLMAIEYREEMLPRAKKAYALMLDKYGEMLASYPRVLDVQRKLYELQIEYIVALESVWTSGIALQGFLLTDGLEAPARPGEVDLPIRETNVPIPERAMAPRESMRNP